MSNQGRVEIKFITDTKELENAKQKVNEFGTHIDKALDGAGADGVSDSISKIGDSSTKSTGGVKSLVGALGLLKVGAVALNAITSSIDDAVSRVDTMNQYPKVLAQMGFEAEESERSISRLSEGIQGLPTRLNDVVATSQRFVTTFRDVDKATETTLALNNALLASGASGQAAANSTDQYVKMLSSGKVEMDAWNSLTENMNYALVEVSAQMGYSSENTWELYQALKDGEVTLDDFNDALIRASTAQGGFGEVALTASEGIATSMANIKTAIVTGVANAIQALDDLIEAVTGKGIAKHFDTIKVTIADAFKVIATSIRNAQPYLRTAIKLISGMKPIVAGIIAAQGALAIYTKAMATATAAKATFAAASAALVNPLGMVVAGIGLAVGAFVLFSDTTSGLSDEVKEFSEGIDEVNRASDDLASASEKNRETFEQQREAINGTEQSYGSLIGILEEITAKESASAAERETALGIASKLNNEIEGLGLAYDAETNSLNISTDALRDNIKQRAELERNARNMDRLLDLEIETADARDQLKEVEASLEAVRKKREEIYEHASGYTFADRQEITAVLNALKGDYTELNNLISANEAEMNGLGESIGAYSESVATATDETIEAVKMTTEEIKSLADEWESLSLDEKQVKVEAMGQDEIEELMQLLGVDFDSLPDEFHKDAYLNAYGYDALEEILFLTGEWEELTLEEKKVILEAQFSTDELIELIDTRDLWNDEEFIKQVAEINMNDNNAEQQVLNVINTMGELDGLEPVALEFDTRQMVEATEAATIALGSLKVEQQAVIEDLRVAYADYASLATDAFTEVATASETSIQEMIEISGKNREAMLQMSEDVVGLRERFEGLGLDQSIIDQFSNMGAESPGLITELANATDTELAALVANTDTKGTELQTALTNMFDVDMEQMPEGFSNLITNVEADLKTQIEEADLKSIGKDVVDDVATGVGETNENMTEAGGNIVTSVADSITENSETAKTAGTGLGEAIDNAFASALGIASPSQVFVNHGMNVVAGATQGINENKPTFVQAARTMATEAIEAFAAQAPQAVTAGANLGDGFNEGLASRRTAILATARSIANAAAETINRALQTRSPSRKGMYSGEMLGLGVEKGMEGKLKDIESMAERVGEKAIPSIDPIDINHALDVPYNAVRQNAPMPAAVKAALDNEVADLLRAIANKDTNIVLDDGTLVGKLGPKYDRFYGNLIKDKKRWGG